MKKTVITLLFFTAVLNAQWIKQTTPTNVDALVCIDFYNQNIGVAGGYKYYHDFVAKTIFTTNSGVNWILSSLPDSARTVDKIQLINQSTGYIAGTKYSNFQNFSLNRYHSLFSNNFAELVQNYFVDNDYYSHFFRVMFLKTTNGGQNWFNWGNLPSNVERITGLNFIDINTGYILASINSINFDKYQILRTINGGQMWNSLITLDSVNLFGLFTTDNYTIFATGLKYLSGSPIGIILKSTNSGINWARYNISNTILIRDIAFMNMATGFAIAESWGAVVHILRTTDAGYNWAISCTSPANCSLYGIEFVQGLGKGIAVGAQSITAFARPLIYRTTDYGDNWSSYSLPDTSSLIDQSLADQNTWFVCGGSGPPVIYKSTNGGEIGIVQISNQIPNSFKLFQNYPNPFNPITKIRFQIPLSRGVDAEGRRGVLLAVYDVLGREITTLVNEQLSPGTYEVDFDGMDYPSGVYNYILSAGNFKETKKMVLLR